MARMPVEVVQAILDDPTNLEAVRALVAPDATYVSLNDDNPELRRIMPWAGTRFGPEAIVDTYSGVRRYWASEAFAIHDIVASGETVALFGRFTYRSNTLGKAATSPFSILARVRDGRVAYMQFLEDTFATAATFRTGGVATFRSDPDGAEVSL